MILKFWKRWFGKETAGQVMNPVCHETKAAPKVERPSAPLPMLERLEAHLFDRYDFRFNDKGGYPHVIGGISRLFDMELWNYAALRKRMLSSPVPQPRMKSSGQNRFPLS